MTGRRLILGSIGLILLTFSVSGCEALFGSSSTIGEGTRPAVAILSPDAGDSFAQGSTVEVQVAAADPGGPGVTLVKLEVDGVTVDSHAVPESAQSNFNTSCFWTADTSGAHALSVIAYRADNTASSSCRMSTRDCPSRCRARPDTFALSRPTSGTSTLRPATSGSAGADSRRKRCWARCRSNPTDRPISAFRPAKPSSSPCWMRTIRHFTPCE